MFRARTWVLVAGLLLPAGTRAQTPDPGTDPEVRALLLAGEESPELLALRLAEAEMFGRSHGTGRGEPRLRLGPPSAATSDAPEGPERGASGAADLSWLQGLTLPDLPIRWDARVVRFLEFFRGDDRGRLLMGAWLRRSNRYGAMIADTLRAHDLPQDLRCVAMAESGFDPTVRSGRGAAGMWQFVSRTGAEYGLTQSHWVDERLDPVRSTDAAARYLDGLYRRLGSWELALAAYNMGYGALLRAIRKYNTNDYWTLAEVEAGLPFETTLYVAKILACAVVMRNPERFGYGDLNRDPPLEVATVDVPGGAPLSQVARAAGIDREELTALNPSLRRNRTPPSADSYAVHIPRANVDRFVHQWSRIRSSEPAHHTHVVRFGESLQDVARRYRTSSRELRELNELDDEGDVSAGLTLLVPAVRPVEPSRPEEPPVVTVPQRRFHYPDRRRVFYRVSDRDTIDEIARFFDVAPDELRLWNNVDASASLHDGLMLQIFAPAHVDLRRAVVMTPDEVRVLVLGTEEFFTYHEAQRGRVRFRYTVHEGDTLRSLADRFDLSTGSIARINRFSRRTDLTPGQEIIIYAAPEVVPDSAPPSEGSSDAAGAPEEASKAEEPSAAAPGALTEATTEPSAGDGAQAPRGEAGAQARPAGGDAPEATADERAPAAPASSAGQEPAHASVPASDPPTPG